MREILFKGKHIDNGEWLEGDFQHFRLDDGEIVAYINSWGEFLHRVNPKTVGQYTGFTDINDKKLFEGDIVRLLGECLEEPIVFFVWNERRAMFMCRNVKDEDCEFYVDGADSFLLLGNIHDNPELLKGGNNE